MAENEGLFSNLRFSDIFFPAAASIASAYNPYIGYGLNTGMAMFNTMADFQHGLRAYKMAREQQRKEEEALGTFQGGIDKNTEFLKQRLSEQDQLRLQLGDLQDNWQQTASGIERLVTLPGSQLEGIPLRFSDMVGVGKELDPSGELPGRVVDEDAYQAMRDRIASNELARAMSGVSGGSAASFLAGLGQQAHADYLTKSEYQRAHEIAQEENEMRLIANTTLSNTSTANALKIREAQKLAKMEELEAALEYTKSAQEVYNLARDVDLTELSDEELRKMASKLNDGLAHMYSESPEYRRINEPRFQQMMNEIYEILDARRAARGAGNGVNSIVPDPAADAQQRLKELGFE